MRDLLMAETSLSPVSQEEPEAASTAIRSIEVDPEGDIYLLLADRELRVSSKTLARISSVFKAQFSPRWAEGKLVSETNPGRVPCPDQDPEVMTVICNVTHSRPAYPPAGQELEFLEKLSVTCDYYDCITALSLWCSVHLGALISSGNISNDGRMFLLTYFFDDYHGFKQVTRRMVYTPYWPCDGVSARFVSPTPYGLSQEAQESLPQNLIRTLLTKELQLKIRLLKDLEEIFEPFLKRIPKEYWDGRGPAPGKQAQKLPMHSKEFASVCNNRRIANIFKDLAEYGLFPMATLFNEHDLDSLLQKVEHFSGDHRRLPGGRMIFPCWEGYIHCWECDSYPMSAVHHLRERIKAAFPGLCLDCVKKGEYATETDTKACRIPHDEFLGIELHRVPGWEMVQW